jgi:hypothetical protein
VTRARSHLPQDVLWLKSISRNSNDSFVTGMSVANMNPLIASAQRYRVSKSTSFRVGEPSGPRRRLPIKITNDEIFPHSKPQAAKSGT